MAEPMSASELSHIVGAIYDCALDPERWSTILAELRGRLNFCQAVVSLVAMPSGEMLLNITSGIGPRWLETMPLYGQAILEQWGGRARIQSTPFDEPALLSRVNPDAHKSGAARRYYEEWREPQGLIDTMNVILVRDSRTIGVMGFGRHRDAGPIGEHEIATAQLLIPHLQRAAAISRLLDVRTMAAATFEAALDTLSVPVVLTGPQLQVVHANRAARALLAEGDLIRSCENILTAQSRGVGAALAAAVSQAVENESAIGRKGFAVPARTAQGGAYVLHVLPLRYGAMRRNVAPSAAAAIFIAPATQPARAPGEVVAALFGLTAAEVRVFEHITAGRTITETAKALGVGTSTIRTHLLRLFDKIGVRRQADLVALGASFALPVEA